MPKVCSQAAIQLHASRYFAIVTSFIVSLHQTSDQKKTCFPPVDKGKQADNFQKGKP